MNMQILIPDLVSTSWSASLHTGTWLALIVNDTRTLACHTLFVEHLSVSSCCFWRFLHFSTINVIHLDNFKRILYLCDSLRKASWAHRVVRPGSWSPASPAAECRKIWTKGARRVFPCHQEAVWREGNPLTHQTHSSSLQPLAAMWRVEL